MAKQVTVLAAKLDNMSSSPRLHVVEGINWLSQVVLCHPHAGHGIYVPTYVHKHMLTHVGTHTNEYLDQCKEINDEGNKNEAK